MDAFVVVVWVDKSTGQIPRSGILGIEVILVDSLVIPNEIIPFCTSEYTTLT